MYRDLVVWQKGMDLVDEIYARTAGFPPSEIYGLTNQLRRAAVAIPSDIAEGKGRLSKKEFLQMLAKARGSCFEVQTQLDIAARQRFLQLDHHHALVMRADEVGRLLNGLIARLQKDIASETRRRLPRARKPGAKT